MEAAGAAAGKVGRGGGLPAGSCSRGAPTIADALRILAAVDEELAADTGSFDDAGAGHYGVRDCVAAGRPGRGSYAALAKKLMLSAVCRTPYCDAPIRHHDHIISRFNDGPTTAGNGQGLCEGCNHTKETPGWSARPIPGPGVRHTVQLQTPTGRTYQSTAPALPGTLMPGRPSRRRCATRSVGAHTGGPSRPEASVKPSVQVSGRAGPPPG